MPDCLLTNLAALWATDPSLAMAVDVLPDDRRLATEPSRAGPPTARAAGPDGVARYLHSRYDPRREAATLADAHLNAPPDSTSEAGRTADPPLCCVVCGVGLGYLVAELLDRLPEDGAVIAVEPDPAALASAMELHDFARAIRAGRLTFITDSDTGHLHERLGSHTLRLTGGLRFVTSPAAEQLAGPFFAQVRAGVADFVAYTRIGLVTAVLNHEITARNLCNNLSWYLAAPPINLLRGRFAGCPGVVVSAGPSLAAALPVLRSIRDRVVIVAVQTALRPLLEAGISPHFVTSLDYHEIGQRFFQDLPAEQAAEVHLVAEPKANWQVIDAFVSAAQVADAPPMISMLGNDFLDTLLGEAAPKKQRLAAGATVAHLAFYLAQHLGCDPIAFVGQDLGFSNGTYYTPGTAIHRVWAGELNRFNSLESMEWQRIVRDRARLRRLTDVHGRPIYTDEQMFTYLQQFQRDFAEAPQRIFDAGGGVAKVGAEPMDPAEFARRFATRPLPPDALAYRRQADWFDPSRLPAARDGLTRRREQVEELAGICDRTLGLLERLVELLETDPAGFNRTLAEVDELRAWVQQHADIYGLVTQVSQTAELARLTADRSLRVRGTEGVAKRRFQLARDKSYVRAIREGCDRLGEILRGAIERLDRGCGNRNAESGFRNSCDPRSAQRPMPSIHHPASASLRGRGRPGSRASSIQHPPRSGAEDGPARGHPSSSIQGSLPCEPSA